tara:strand:+ start:7231 stop:7701 length:471 start_codon:yes stop_codon:yes gene_type:complete
LQIHTSSALPRHPASARINFFADAKMLHPAPTCLLQVLERAYNDHAGVTALFNLNLVERIRNELDSDIDPRSFQHRAFYNEAESRIEMHLISRQAQQVRIEDRVFDFAAGETLHTENSYKYTPSGFRDLAGSCGFASAAMWRDPAQLFSVHFLRRE